MSTTETHQRSVEHEWIEALRTSRRPPPSSTRLRPIRPKKRSTIDDASFAREASVVPRSWLRTEKTFSLVAGMVRASLPE